MIFQGIMFLVGLLTVAVGFTAGCIGILKNSKNHIVFGAVSPVVTWLAIAALDHSHLFQGEWP